MNEFEPLDQKCSLNADNIEIKIRTFSFILLGLGKGFSSSGAVVFYLMKSERV